MRERKAPEDRKAQILETACSLIGEHGYKKVSMQLVANHCNISKAALYVYFASKDELFAEVVSGVLQHRLQQVLSAVQKPLPIDEKLSAMLNAAFQITAYKPESMHSLIDTSQHFAQQPFAEHMAQFKALLAGVIESACDNDEIRLPPVFKAPADAANFLINAGLGVVGGLDMQSDLPVQEQMEQLINQLITSLMLGWRQN